MFVLACTNFFTNFTKYSLFFYQHSNQATLSNKFEYMRKITTTNIFAFDSLKFEIDISQYDS